MKNEKRTAPALARDGKPLYTIATRDGTDVSCADAIGFLNRAIKARLGASLPVNDGSIAHSVTLALGGLIVVRVPSSQIRTD